ncbi:tetratricopeptide repeat protein [Sulfitobacter sp.]|uniref:tetratricopeptide repeat protein n=1 Tax=Sulfitobacter sp. TaxID=1903071 RepID=UPI0040597068
MQGVLKPQTLAVVCVAVALSVAPHWTRAQQNAVELSLPEARALAAHALSNGRPELASKIAGGLLEADPRSTYGHYVLANAYAEMGRIREGRQAASRAYRYSTIPVQKFEAAELAARLSYAQERPTLTQLWLRRAVQHAPSAQIEAQLAKDYAKVRQQNPFSFSLSGGLRPSTNVNNGADTAQQVIDGLPFTGQLSGSAQALSGVIGSIDGIVGYRLRGTATSRMDVSARVFVQRIALDCAANTTAPDVRNSDLASTYGEIALNQQFAIGSPGSSVDLNAAVGRYWIGGNPNYGFVRLGAGHQWQMNARTALTLNSSVEQRFSARSDIYDSRTLGVVAGARHTLGWGDSVSVSLNLLNTASDFVNSRVSAAAVRMTYSFADQIGPALVSVGLVLGRSDYPDYVAVFNVPGGKQDRSAYADVNIFLPDMDYAGFAPTVRIRAGRTQSNVSRFDTREISVAVGIRSKF